MNLRLVAKYLGVVSVLIGACMALSLPWAHPALGGGTSIESAAVAAILTSMTVACLTGLPLFLWGRRAVGTLFRKEALAIVGLSWILASVLGALPFVLSGTSVGPNERMLPHDALFESVSGFTGSGATVLNDLEDPNLVPRSILFWRSETHFLGGLGILVLFVALLGQGSAGKALMRAEMPGPSKDVPHARMQHAAWIFAGVYCGLNVVLTALLMLEGMNLFDALCHSFATIATGGFSTYNASVGHFDDATIEMTIAFFMFVACINFTLLYYVVLFKPLTLFRDVEFRVYAAILLGAVLAVMGFGLAQHDFTEVGEAVRYTVFNVTSVMTNTGFVTRDFDTWSQFARATLFLLMFVGGCAGSTSCSIKVIRHILLWKILKLEIEKAYHPSVVRPLRLQGEPVDDTQIAKHVLVYFGMIAFIFVVAWVALLGFEPDSRWMVDGSDGHAKFIDCASGVAATLNGVGPGLGTFGSTENFSSFTVGSKIVFMTLMLMGRLEVIPVVVLFLPRFWKAH